jgi:hypothetical protein
MRFAGCAEVQATDDRARHRDRRCEGRHGQGEGGQGLGKPGRCQPDANATWCQYAAPSTLADGSVTPPQPYRVLSARPSRALWWRGRGFEGAAQERAPILTGERSGNSSSFALQRILRRGGRQCNDESQRNHESESFADLRFREQALVDLLGALRARAASHPDNPGLIACWPAVPEHRMPGACSELARLGYRVRRVSIAGWEGGKAHDGWALGA